MISSDGLLPQQEIYNFLRSCTILFSPWADYVNATLVTKGYTVNAQDKTSWKYYLNLIGEYHISDTQMMVTSLDTRQEILFSPAVLVNHPRTKSAYSPGGDYYTSLCNRFPDQVDLIKSILFPVPSMNSALTAKDLTLLAYGEGYLEPSEEPILIDNLRRFLDVVNDRWYFTFLDDEPYFHLTFWAGLWCWVGEFLLTERASLIQTPAVHSWHIWNALKAQGLDDYSDILDREKAMWLYQNIDYLKANAGKQSNLILLANNLLRDFGVGLYGRRVLQESATGAAVYQLTPQLTAVRVPTDFSDLATEVPTETVSTIQAQIVEKGLASDDTAETVATIERSLGDTTLNNYMTKFLEIRPIAKNKPYADMLNMFLLETLVVSIQEGLYTNSVEIIDPVTNNVIFLQPRELLALYHYASTRAVNSVPEDFPTTVNLYTSFLATIGTPVKTLPRGDEILYISEFVDADAFLADLQYATILEIPQDFSTMATNLWLRYMDHLLQDERSSLDQTHVVLDYLSSLCHTRRQAPLSLITGYSGYEEWLGSSGVDLWRSTLSQYTTQSDPLAAWGDLADSIISALVPLTDVISDFGNFTLSDAGYTRLRELFVQMCSYRVVFLESDRTISEFPFPFKASYHMGPDITVQVSEEPLILYAQHTHVATAGVVVDQHPGITEMDAVTVVQTETLYEPPETLVVTNVTILVTEQRVPIPQTPSVNQISGSLTMGHAMSGFSLL